MTSQRVFAAGLVIALLGGFSARMSYSQTVEEGFKSLENEQTGKARQIFSQLAQTNPTAENYFYLGNFYLTQGLQDSARASFTQGLAVNSKSALNLVGQGELELLANNTAGAETAFKQAVKNSKSKDAEVFYRIGLAYMKMKTPNLEKAIDNFKKAIDVKGEVAAYYVALGEAYLATRKEAGKASTNFEQALYFDEHAARAHVGLGDIFELAKDYNQALRKYQDAVTADPTYAPAYRRLGEIYFLAKQYDKAAENYKQYIALSSPTDEKLFTLAGYYYLNNQFTESLDVLKQLSPNFDNPVMYRLLAYSYYETQQTAPGLEAMQQFLSKAKPEDVLPNDYEYMGRLKLANSDTLGGIASLRQAIAADTSKNSLYKEIAGYFFNSRRFAEAAAEYARMDSAGLKLTGTDLLNQGKSYYYSQQYGKADTVFAQVNEIASQSNTGWLWRARTNAKLDPESTQGLAKPFYEKYIELTTDTLKFKRDLVEANFYLGYYYFTQKDNTQAEPYLNQVITLEPEHENAKILLEAIAEAK